MQESTAAMVEARLLTQAPINRKEVVDSYRG